MKYPLLVALVAALSLFACGGGDDSPPPQEPLPACLAPGNYMMEWTVVSDTCEVGNLPTELITIRPDGTGAGDFDAPDGCRDSLVTDVDCVRDFSRSCSFDVGDGLTTDFEYDFVFDFNRGTGSITMQGRVYDGSDLLGVCVSTQSGQLSSI